MALFEVKALQKSFQEGENRHQVLKSISLKIEPSEFVALCGPSGSGKSTLLNICGLLDSPDEGELIWRGHLVNFDNTNELTRIRRQHVGFVFQTFNLIPVMTVFDNVEYPLMQVGMEKSKRKTQVLNILEQVGLKGFENYLPDRLSGGQRQRVAVARALVKKPELVIADEPTANLDTETAFQIIYLMKQLCQEYQATFLIATHDSRMTDHCDRIVRLQDGCLENQLSNQEKENDHEVVNVRAS